MAVAPVRPALDRSSPLRQVAGQLVLVKPLPAAAQRHLDRGVLDADGEDERVVAVTAGAHLMPVAAMPWTK